MSSTGDVDHGDAPDAPPELAHEIRAALAEASYTQLSLVDRAGETGLRAVDAGDAAPLLARTVGSSPLDTLIRLFVAGRAVDEGSATAAFGKPGVDGWARAGLVAKDGSTVRPLVALTPVTLAVDWVIAHDLPTPSAERADYVQGVGPTAVSLAGITARGPVERALDIGVGGGIQSLLASLHSTTVVATDTVPRALAFARFNCALNGVGNVECRRGDRLEPVAGEVFNLIVCNPPFVISPEHHLLYRDGGLPGDAMSASIAAAAGAHLAPGGWCHMTGSWVHQRGESWQDRVAGWVDDSGCDTWALQHRLDEPSAYAYRWLAGGDVAGRYPAWVDYYRREGIDAIGSGLITMRKTDGRKPWFRASELSQQPEGQTAPAVALGFALQDWLMANPGRDDLLASRLAVAADVRFEASYVQGPGGWEAAGAVLRQVSGLRRRVLTPVSSAELLGGCNGARPLGEVLSAWAEATGRSSEDPASHLDLVRSLVADGFLVPG